MTLTWRPLEIADAAPLAELLAAAEKADPVGEHYSAEDMAEELESPAVDLAEGSLSGWDGEQLVAYAVTRVRDSADPVHQLRFEITVHPAHRDDGIGTRIIDWLVPAATRLSERRHPGAPLELHAGVHENQRWLAELLESAGFCRARSFLDMRAELGALPARREVPGDLRLVRYEEKYDDPTRLARNVAFAEHWGSAELSPEAWRHLITGSTSFRPDLSFLLLSGEEVSAFVLGAHFESDTAATGIRELHVSYVGTRPELRGRGAATALLGHTLAEAKAAGFQRSVLGVDADNDDAIGVYERCGYAVSQRRYGYVRAVS